MIWDLSVRYLGIDYGATRIGLALSDPEGRMAFPHATVKGFRAVLEVVRKGKIGALVIGLPLIPGKAESAQARAIRAFAAKLAQRVELPIVFESELYTTKIAEQHTPRKKADASAAALILQSYLDKLWSKSEARNPKSEINSNDRNSKF